MHFHAVSVSALLAMSVLACAAWAAPADLDPQTAAAVQRAVNSLRATAEGSDSGQDSIAAYALLKAGVAADDPVVNTIVQRVRGAIRSGTYEPRAENCYVPGCDLMLLEAADPKQYRADIQAIANFLISRQLPNGSWFYLDQSGGGDTSQAQYALLGLWAAQRAGVNVPTRVWDRAADWHIKTQLSQGGFAYHPLGGDQTAKQSLTVNGISSLVICRMHLYPHAGEIGARPKAKPPTDQKKFGVLEQVDLDTVESEQPKKVEGPVTVSLERIDAAIQRAEAWMGRFYRIVVPDWNMYYLYGLERMAALADWPQVAGHDWYAEGSAFLLRQQTPDGSWQGTSSPPATTAFGVLFLTRATSKLLNRAPPEGEVGSGLLIGGRGLPENLGRIELDDGKVQPQKALGPLDELLGELEKLETAHVESAQAAIVERIQIGDRENLVGQKERIVRLLEDSRPEVRRTALWAIGQSADLSLARPLVTALDDKNLDIIIEAHNALCALSRLPRGHGLPASPWEDLPATATETEREAAANRWKAAVREKWRAWYLRVRPYEERDDLFGVSP